jgi:hypothetical protein
MFALDKVQKEKLKKWSEKIESADEGAIGGRFTYSFTPTNLGVVINVIDNITKKERIGFNRLRLVKSPGRRISR